MTAISSAKIGVYGNPADYNCKILGQKEILVVHNGYPKGEWIEGKHMAGPNDYYQLVRVYINEMKPINSHLPFSKIIHYAERQLPRGEYRCARSGFIRF